ncbi:hypothetical protein [Morganella psychrotolerans]|nr:hypothetical protein [Morganella psychrotolerans]
MFQNHWKYPNKIGHHLSSLETQFKSGDMANTEQGQKLREKFNKHIDVEGWKTYWPQIDAGYQEFETLQNNIIQLYSDFLTNPDVSHKPGGIKHYIDHAFLIKEQYMTGDFWHHEFFDELVDYCELHGLLFTPLNSSPSGRKALDLLFSVDVKEGSVWKAFIRNLLTILDEDEIKNKALTEFKQRVLPALRSAVMICWDALGYAYAEVHPLLGKAKNQVRFISKAGLDFLARKVLPAFLSYYGIEVSFDELEYLSAEKFRKWMNSLNSTLQPFKSTAKKMRKMFDWDKRLQSAGLQKVIATAKFKLKNSYYASGLPLDKQSLMMHIKFGSDVYTLISSVIELSTVSRTKEFELNTPLHAAAVSIFRIQIVSHILNTADSLIGIRKAAGIYAGAVTFPPLQRLLTQIKLPEVQTKWGKAGLKGLGYTVAFIGFALPVAEASSEFMDSNYITGSAKVTEAVGSLAFSAGMAGLGITEAGGAVTAFISLFAWELVIAGVVLMGGGIAIYLWFKTDDFEELLKQCFWGNGDKYFAGGREINNNSKIKRDPSKYLQLKKYINFFENYYGYYQTEIQEFNNLFFTSQLQINVLPKSNIPRDEIYYGGVYYIIQYQFKLSNFQCGVSEIEYQLVEKKALYTYPSGMPAERVPERGNVVVTHHGIEYLASLKEKFNAAFESALQRALEKTLKNIESAKKLKSYSGNIELKFEVDAGVFAGDPSGKAIPSVYWYYLVDRINGDIAPLRYRDNNPDDKIYGCIDGDGTE